MMNNAIKHPSHYAEGRKYEPKDVIRDWGLNFNLGNAVKYISRAGRKDDIVQELKKAQEYLQFEIDAIKAERGIKPKVEAITISLKELFKSGIAGFIEGLQGDVPQFLSIEDESFAITEVVVNYNTSDHPTGRLYCRNDDFELELRSKR